MNEQSSKIRERAAELAPLLRMAYSDGYPSVVYAGEGGPPEDLPGVLHLTDTTPAGVAAAFAEYRGRIGTPPSFVAADDIGYFALGETKPEADHCLAVATHFCPAESSLSAPVFPLADAEEERHDMAGRLAGRIAIVTGSAQGFGQGIAEAMAREGAYVVIADMNGDGAQTVAREITEMFGAGRSLSVSVDVTEESSVKAMIEETVLHYGGLDIFVNNAGVVRAGSLEEMQKSAFEFVTAVNYTAYFLCAKYASVPMKRQRLLAPQRMADIIEINSKSGLSGSNKNFAYAGSKFGGIGLTQSFALELAEYGIKVNAVCPGNFLDGPLWTDPEKGLFVQYLRAGKVPGAETVEDVRRFYEGKVPLGRGCRTEDVARAIFYLVEQAYETGQALPVTGGQEMIR